MPYILDISTAVPDYCASKKDLVSFYSNALESIGEDGAHKKLTFLTEKTKIKTRYSCLPDFNGDLKELYQDENFNPSVEDIMAVYKDKILPISSRAIDQIYLKNNVNSEDITHLITVSCTGLFAPGLEFLISEKYGLQNTEKLGLNFLGCYAAIKALKQANFIAKSEPKSCILIVCAELCTLHFNPSSQDEDIVSNLLFADGSSAVLVCGNDNSLIKDKKVLSIDSIGSRYIPNTLGLMTWNLSSKAFRMYLSKNIVSIIKSNIKEVVDEFLVNNKKGTDYWAIHPGGAKIVEGVQESLSLKDEQIEDSLSVLQDYGNMSSPTILFILKRIFDKIKNEADKNTKSIFACAFGPGLSIEMLGLSSKDLSKITEYNPADEQYAVQG